MANIILPEVELTSTLNSNANVLIEDNGTIKRTNIENILPELDYSDVVTLNNASSIPKNTDLDTILTIGNYKVTSPNVYKALKNSPVNNDFFIMRVGNPVPGIANYFYQELVTMKGIRFYRYYSPKEKWHNWRQTFSSNQIIPARYAMGENISSDFGEEEHLKSINAFVVKMNEMAKQLGMNNTEYKTPSGLCSKPINANKTSFDIAYNSHSTALDQLRLMIAIKHTHAVLKPMGSLTNYYFKNDGAYYANHTVLYDKEGDGNWDIWQEANNLTVLAVKGGSLVGEYGEKGSKGILNFVFLIQKDSEIYAAAVMGLNAKSETETAGLGDGDGNDYDVCRTLVSDMINMLNGGAETEVITAARTRADYPVGMACVKLTGNNFDADIAGLSEGIFFNENIPYVTASIAKVMTALVATHHMKNADCTVNYDDLVGGANAVSFAVGDRIGTTDALNLVLTTSSNILATMLARVCGEEMQSTNFLSSSTTKGQFIVSDGNGGVQWVTLSNVAEVGA